MLSDSKTQFRALCKWALILKNRLSVYIFKRLLLTNDKLMTKYEHYKYSI